ncbi:hypothetical protein AUP68_15737 [Ilyonectria robusta]
MYAADIEDKINELPYVHESAVMPVTDQEFGQRVAAVIQVKSQHELPSLKQLRYDLQPSLPQYKMPTIITLVDGPLLRTTTGKLAKTAIRKNYVETETSPAVHKESETNKSKPARCLERKYATIFSILSVSTKISLSRYNYNGPVDHKVAPGLKPIKGKSVIMTGGANGMDPEGGLTEPDLNIVRVNLDGALYTGKLAVHDFWKQQVNDERDRCFIITGSMVAWIESPETGNIHQLTMDSAALCAPSDAPATNKTSA